MTRFPTGVNMPYDSKGKNRYSFDESRNLSRGREYKSFQHHSSPSHQTHPLVEIEVETEAEGASLRRSHQLTPPRWGGKRTGFVGSRQATENPVNPSHREPLPEEGPRAASFLRFGDRVIRNPTAAKPRDGCGGAADG